MDTEKKQISEEIISTSCLHDCGGACLLRAHVKEGVATRVETDSGEEPQLRACVRGRAFRHKVYAPDRLKFPLKRTGIRGEGKFERISWDEALDKVASELKRIKETYGSSGIFFNGRGGSRGVIHNSGTIGRVLEAFCGYVTLWGGPSAEANVFASRATYGTLLTANSRNDLLNSRLIILWGCNPASSIWSTGTPDYLCRAKENGAELVAVDPMLNATIAPLGKWIPIRPATDTAMLVAMAFVMIEEGLHDRKFLDTYTVGFDKFEDYVTGKKDGVPKTPGWAESITGVKAETIVYLARKYATTKPAALFVGFGPGRTAFGEQFHRAASVLACMTGNVGISGGEAAGFGRGPQVCMLGPVDSTVGGLDTLRRNKKRVHFSKIWDGMLEGKAGGYPTDARLFYVAASDPVTQFLNTNKGKKALQKPEFIVVQDIFMTSTARFADILLPVTSSWERNDIVRHWYFGPYYLHTNKVIEPLYESKSDYDIAVELAKRLGLNDFTRRSDEERLKEYVTKTPDLAQDIHDYDKFKKDGFHKLPVKQPIITFELEITDPKHHPFPTPSGKIEIYSERLAAFNNPNLPPIPEYIEPWEGPQDPLSQKYPLQMFNPSVKNRSHSNFDNIPLLREVEPQSVWINTSDASARGIRHEELVEVFNERGTVLIQANVTERIMPGVIALAAGAWVRFDEKGRDIGGCPNVLTKDEFSPGGGYCSNSCLVEIRRAPEVNG